MAHPVSPHFSVGCQDGSCGPSIVRSLCSIRVPVEIGQSYGFFIHFSGDSASGCGAGTWLR